jgi:hypothetical protein
MGVLVEAVEAQNFGILAVYVAINLQTETLVIHELIPERQCNANRTGFYNVSTFIHGQPPWGFFGFLGSLRVADRPGQSPDTSFGALTDPAWRRRQPKIDI